MGPAVVLDRPRLPGAVMCSMFALAAGVHGLVPPTPFVEPYVPEYCHHTDPLEIVPLVKDAELLQATILHRHGDRVMFSGGGCWENDSMEGNFECTLSSAAAVVDDRTKDEGQKKLVNNRIFEHIYAAREPIPYKGCDVGQLTKKGQLMQIQTGVALRKTYVDTGFLSSTFNPDEVYLRADTVPRVIQSLESLVNGMFPRNESAMTGANGLMDIEFVPLHMINIDLDPTNLDNTKFCQRAALYKNLTWAPQTATPKREAFEQWREAVFARARAAGLPSHRLYAQSTDMYLVWDCMCVHLCHKFSTPVTPAGLDRDVFDELERVFIEENKWSLSFPTLQAQSRVGVGILLKEWLERWETVIAADSADKEPKYHKFAEYSGHDSTMLALLVALDFQDFKWPRYSTLAQFELYRMDSKHYMRLIYNSKVVDPLPFCAKEHQARDGLCEYASVQAWFKEITPEDVVAECSIDDAELLGLTSANQAAGAATSNVISYIHKAVPMWMYLTSMLACLTVGAAVGLVFTQRAMAKALAARSAQDERRPLHEGDLSDFSEDEDEEDEGVHAH